MQCAGLLERESPLAAVEQAVADGLGRRASGAVLLEATAGIGKTAVVERAAAAAEARGARVLRARGTELERAFPFGLVLQLLAPVLADADADRRAALLRGPAALAGPLLEGRLLGNGPLEAHALPPLLHGLHWLVVNLADAGPVVLAVDDLHWADPSSLRALAYLAARAADVRVAFVGAARPDEPGAPAELHALRADPAVTTVALDHLSPAASAALVQRTLGPPAPAFAGACFEATGGNPLLLIELAAAVRDEGLAPTGDAVARVRVLGPAPVARALQLALRRLAPEATAVARSAAILGDDAHPSLIRRLAGLPAQADLGALLAALDAARVLALTAAGGVRFAHPILRAALVAELRDGERALAHARAAELLHGEGRPDAVVAAHLLAALPDGRGWAVDVLRRAARDAVELGLPAQAAELLGRALREPPPADQRTGVLLELARAEAAAGLPGADEHLRAVLGVLDDARDRAQLQLDLGRIHYGRGEQLAAAEAFGAGLDALPPDPSDPLVQELGAGYLTAASVEGTLREAALRRVEALLADRPPDSPTARVVLAQRTIERALDGAPREEVVDLAERAWGDGALLAEQSSDGLAVYHVTGALFWVDALALQRTMLEAALDDARRRGSVHGFATASYCCCWPRLLRGRVDAAAADAEQALAATASGWALFVPSCRAGLALALHERGDRVGAWTALEVEDSLALAGAGAMAPLVHEAHGRLLAADGDVAGALAAAERAGAVLAALGWDTPAYCPWRSLAAQALVQRGDLARAAELAAAELALATPTGTPRAIGVAQRAVGLSEGDPASRVAMLQASVATLRTSPSELELVRSLLALGMAERQASGSRAARVTLREALDRASGLGLVRLATRAREELVVAGGRPRRTRLGGPEALTPAERRVCDLVAEGRSNREVAQALFVTPKAVEYHLRNAYGKLQIRRRSELPAALAPQG